MPTKRRVSKLAFPVSAAAVELFRAGDLKGAQRALSPHYRPWWPTLDEVDHVRPEEWRPGADAVHSARAVSDHLRRLADG